MIYKGDGWEVREGRWELARFDLELNSKFITDEVAP